MMCVCAELGVGGHGGASVKSFYLQVCVCVRARLCETETQGSDVHMGVSLVACLCECLGLQDVYVCV